MLSLPWLNFTGFLLCFAGILLPLVVYPAAMAVLSFMPARRSQTEIIEWPTLSWVIVARNAEDLLAEKIRNCFAVDYPDDRIQVVCFSDGSSDGTKAAMDAAARAYPGRVVVLHNSMHVGKFTGLTAAANAAVGDLLVFSDADAMIAPDGIKALIRPFMDASMGGVCGRRVIAESTAKLAQPQSNYIAFDSMIKVGESRLGRLTSNDGKLYAIRRVLFTDVPAGVTDDLFQALSIIGQGFKFTFAPQAIAAIKMPSRSGGHEISRRRRIVGRSVGAMFKVTSVYKVFDWDPYGVRLLLNKGLRRLLPVFLVGLYLFSALLAGDHWLFFVVWLGQTVLWLLAVAGFWIELTVLPEKVRRLFSLPHYVLLGMTGTLMGVLDAWRGETQDKWDPQKQDGVLRDSDA